MTKFISLFFKFLPIDNVGMSSLAKKRVFIFFSHLVKLGTNKVSKTDEIYVRQANTNGLFFFFLDLLLGFTFYIFFDDTHLGNGLIISGFCFLLSSLGFNALGWTNLSRLSTASIGCLLVAYCGFYLGESTFISASLLLGAIFPFVYFSTKEYIKIIISVFIPLLMYIILIVLDYNLGPKIAPIQPHNLTSLKLILFLIPYSGIFINSWVAVSEREKKNNELLESKKIIETVFFALSHDLANPIQNISFISKLHNKPEDFTDAKIATLKKNSLNLQRIFTNLRDVVKFSIDGKIKTNPIDIEAIETLEEAKSFILDIAKSKNISISIEKETSEDSIKIKVDKDIFIFQVIANFLTNAIKFSVPNSKIELKLSCTKDSVIFNIRDWGCGIDSEKIPKLFNWNERTTTLGTSGEKGSGLGLPLAHKFLLDMNGSLTIESYPKSKFSPDTQGTLIKILMPRV
ncbi:MAG: HAMP domain-containing histidine kinase [Bdellovibrionaceae bacterium]|nr:HAMP domain-containing histidine kinase [Pseudobdellovibrionaceae bacterium]